MMRRDVTVICIKIKQNEHWKNDVFMDKLYKTSFSKNLFCVCREIFCFIDWKLKKISNFFGISYCFILWNATLRHYPSLGVGIVNDKTYQTLFALLCTGKFSTRPGEVNSNQIKILLKNNQTYLCYQTQNVQTKRCKSLAPVWIC